MCSAIVSARGSQSEFPMDHHRRPQPVPPRTSRTRSNRTTAPIVALTIELTIPTPRWIPSLGSNQPPMKAPTIADNQITNKTESGSSDKLTSQPACNYADNNYDEKTFARHVHRKLHDLSRGSRGTEIQRRYGLRVPSNKRRARLPNGGISRIFRAMSLYLKHNRKPRLGHRPIRRWHRYRQHRLIFIASSRSDAAAS